MRFKTLKIRGFRSVGEEPVEIALDRSNFITIVGPNGAGKSTILQALRLLTGDARLDEGDVELTDFHRCQAEKGFSLELTFSQPLTLGDSFNKFTEVVRVQLAAKQYERTEAKGAVRVVQSVLDMDAKPIRLHQTTPLAKGRELSDKEKSGQQSARMALIADLRNQLPVFFIDPTNYQFHLSMRRGSLLAEVTRALARDISRDQSSVEFRGRLVKRSEAIRELSDEMADLLDTGTTQPLLEETSRFLRTQLDLPEQEATFKLSIPDAPELLKRLSLNVHDGPDAPGIPVENCGRGYAALAIVGLFKALRLSGVQSSLVMIEEPESFLTPNARTAFAAELRSLASQGHQVIVVTHSPEFVDALKPEQTIRIVKRGATTSVKQWPVGSPTPAFGKVIKFLEPNLGRLLFSKRIVLVEGADDIAALRAYFEIVDVEPAIYGLEFIQMAGNSHPKVFHDYCEAFELEHVFLVDEDARSRYLALPVQTFQPKDLESSLSTQKMTPANLNTEHVYQTVLSAANVVQLSINFPLFYRAVTDALKDIGIVI